MKTLVEVKPRIGKEEFTQRIERIREEMGAKDLDAVMVYGDEYRKENLRYVSGFWPIFERGALFIPRDGEPVYAGAPEGEPYAREMCAWGNICNLKEFLCVTVVDDIDYPLAQITPIDGLMSDVLRGGRNLGIIGMNDMPGIILDRVKGCSGGLDLRDASDIINRMRIVKTPAEVACLAEAGRLACIAYETLMREAVPGRTELHAAGAAEGAARMAGAEAITFTVFGSGERANTIIGRPTEKVIKDGDMIMSAIAVQYQGYVSTAEFPFVAGKVSPRQRDFLGALMDATCIAVDHMAPGRPMKELVSAVRNYFRGRGLSAYDVYPPMHGIGLAEAEAPYPDEESTAVFLPGMTVNTDISLFGIPGIGGNRVEESFVITETGVESLTPFIRSLCEG